MITTAKQPIQLITTRKRDMLVDKRIVMNKKVNILASNRIFNPVDKLSYIGIDIPQVSLITEDGDNKEDYIVSFDDYDSLMSLKEYMKHPYTLSSVKVEDISYYIEKSKCNLMILRHCKGSQNVYPCESRTYSAYTVSHKDFGNIALLPVSSVDFSFTQTQKNQ